MDTPVMNPFGNQPTYSSPIAPIETPPQLPAVEPEPESGGYLTPILIVAVVLLVAGGAYAWWILNARSTTDDLHLDSTGIAATTGTSGNLAIVPPADATSTAAEASATSTWNTFSFTLGTHTVSFQIPPGHHANGGTDQVTIWPDPTADNDAPLPDMTITLHRGTTLAKEMKAEQSSAPSGDQEWRDITINGVNGKALYITNKGYDDVSLDYLLPAGKDVFDFRLYEDLDWDPFDLVVGSFRITQ